jgi:hypothetical protein
MSVLESLGLELRCIACGVLAALLPRREAHRLGNRCGVDVPPYSMALGLVEATVGGLGFLFGAIGAMSGTVPFLNRLLLEGWFPGLSNTHFMGGGLIALMLWCTHPLAWLLMLAGVTGLFRVFAFVTTRESVGEPLVWLAYAAWGLLAGRFQRQSEKRSFGPLRSDRLVWKQDHELMIMACRPREDWTDSIDLIVEGRYFRLANVKERVEGAYHVMAYRFVELGEHDVIRMPREYRNTPDAVP